MEGVQKELDLVSTYFDSLKQQEHKSDSNSEITILRFVLAHDIDISMQRYVYKLYVGGDLDKCMSIIDKFTNGDIDDDENSPKDAGIDITSRSALVDKLFSLLNRR